ncbi:MAG TPA: isochorismatase family protein [Anaerolineae bacterium]
MKIALPVRFTGNSEEQPAFATLNLEVGRTVFLLVDCDGDCGPLCNAVVEDNIAPALEAARAVGIRGVFLYGEPLPDGCFSIAQELHRSRRGRQPAPAAWRPAQPTWTDTIAPRKDEAVIGKCAQGGFGNSYLDRYLRTHGIENILATGFSFKSCLFYTLVGAFERNYRVIFLRDGTDPPGSNEFPDTVDHSLPEKGWVWLVLTRLIEDHLGYSSTCRELIAACNS